MTDTSRRSQHKERQHAVHGAAAEQGHRAAAEAGRRGGAHAAGTARRSGEAGAEPPPPAGAAAGAAGAPPQAEDAAARLEALVEEIDRSLAEQAMRGRAEDIRRLAAPPAAAARGAGVPEVHRAAADLVEGVLRANLGVVEEVLRLADPGPVVEVQRRLAREYVGALVEGQATLLRAARRAAEEVRRTFEARPERRRQAGGGGRVGDAMSRDVRVASPEDTVQQAARLMREADTGALPVGEGDRLVGMVTDRDVALRLAAEGKDPARTRVREVMTPEVRYLFEDEDLHRAAETMAGQRVRRLPVVDRDRRLVGIVSLADLAADGDAQRPASRALGGVVREGGRDVQVAAE